MSGPGWSACARQGLAVKPRRGDALLFYRHAARQRASHACSAGSLAVAEVSCSGGGASDLVPNKELWRQ